MTIRLDDTIVLVTGAAGGIGRAVCRSLKDAGAIVVASDLAAKAAIPAADDYHPHDVTDRAGWERIAASLKAKYGRLDGLVNIAAIAHVASIENTSLESWRKVQSVNVESLLIGSQVMLELLKASGKTRPGGASIVNFSSVGGQRGAALNSAYCTSKGAVRLFSKCAAIEFAALGYNIRVNSVHPGGIDTEMLGAIMQRYVDLGAIASMDAAAAAIVAQHPIGRLGRAEELGGGVVYLCSTAASFVTGSEFTIDGGFTSV